MKIFKLFIYVFLPLIFSHKVTAQNSNSCGTLNISQEDFEQLPWYGEFNNVLKETEDLRKKLLQKK